METQQTEAKGRILAAAIEVIDAEGDAALRITDIASRAGVATGLINHHFGSRDGLVAAAQAERFSGLVQRDIEQFRTLETPDVTPEMVREAIRAMCEVIASRERAASRMRRISALGAAHGRPELQAALARTSTEMLDEFTNLVVAAQQMDVIRTDITARILASLVMSVALGLVYADLDADPVSPDAMAATIFDIITKS